MIELLCLAMIGFQANPTDITFPGAGLELHGVLSVPQSKAERKPAVLLLPGSGPTDRDGNQPPTITTNILLDLSTFLNDQSFVTLRFDKRPVHRYSSVWPKDMAEMSKFFSMENHLADVEAAYNFLAKQKSVDPKRIYILGHSEGSMFANALGKKLGAKGLILLGSPGRGMDAILREQLDNNLKNVPEGEVKTTLLNDIDRAIKQLKEKPEIPADLHPGLQALFNPSTADIWHGYFNFDPIASAKTFNGPVFIANGEKDIQISAERDAKPLAAAYGDHATLFIVPGASHNMKHVEKETDPGFAGPLVPELLDHLKTWLKKQEG